MHETKGKAKGGVNVRSLVLTLAQSPCDPKCKRRAWNCHVRGNCKEYDDFVDECADLRRRRELEHDVNNAISMAVGRFPGERRV